MYRTFFEIIYFLNIIYLCKLYFSLFLNVVKLRREKKISLGYKDKKLERAIRAHANFCETVPIIMLLSFFHHFNSLYYFAVPTLILLAVGRTIHSNSLSDVNEDLKNRRIGMKLTIYSLFLGVVGIFYYILQMVYYFLIASYNTTFLPQIIILLS